MEEDDHISAGVSKACFDSSSCVASMDQGEDVQISAQPLSNELFQRLEAFDTV